MTTENYSNISRMLGGIGADAELKDEYRDLASQTRLARMLFALRCKAGLTQAEMAERLGCRQSVISRIENSTDAKLSMEDLLRYARALDMQLNIGFLDNRGTVTDRIKYHLMGLDKSIKCLLEMAGDDLSILAGAAGVFEGAASQFLKTLLESVEHVNGVLAANGGDKPDRDDMLQLMTDADLSGGCCGKSNARREKALASC